MQKIVGIWARVGLRSRLFLLVFLATTPLLCLLLGSAFMQRRDAIDSARLHVQDLAQFAAQQVVAAVHGAGDLLAKADDDPVLRQTDTDACAARLRDIANAYPQIDLVMLARPDGRIVCRSSPLMSDVSSVSMSKWFKAALSTPAGQSVVGEFSIGGPGGAPTVIVAHVLPPPPNGGPSPGTLAMSLSGEWLSRTMRLAVAASDPNADPNNIIINLQSGMILAHEPDPQMWLGRSVPSHPLVVALRAIGGRGVIEAPGLDSRPRLFGAATLTGFAGEDIVVATGISRTAVLADANRRLFLGLGIASLACILAFGLAWRLAHCSVMTPLKRLASAVSRIGKGELDARAGLLIRDPPEFRQFGDTLEDMARKLDTRGKEVADAQAVIARNEELYRVLTESSIDIIVRLDKDYRRTYISPACVEMLGYTPQELLGGDARRIVHPEDWDRFAAVLASLNADNPRVSVVYRAVRKDGAAIWVEGLARRFECGGLVVTIRDITRRRLAEEQLERANSRLAKLASCDGLTGLLNRRGFDEALGLEYRRSARSEAPIALIMIDVDHFKRYNDAYGHPAGDECLRMIARAIERPLRRPGDIAARYGGEEFAVILGGTDAENALLIGESIRRSVAEEAIVHIGSPMSIVTVSIGVAELSAANAKGGPAKLVEMADAALYSAKRLGRNLVYGMPAQV